MLDEHTGCKGDNDPLDVLEIGYKVCCIIDIVFIFIIYIFILNNVFKMLNHFSFDLLLLL